MDTCYVEYHRQGKSDEKAFEKELDVLMKRHGLNREGSGCRIEEQIRDIRYEAPRTPGKK